MRSNDKEDGYCLFATMINNNAFEVVPSPRNKRKISAPNPNVYMNPALDLLETEDRICNTTMEVTPAKRSKRSKSCADAAVFENPYLGEVNSNNILAKELWNVKHNLQSVVQHKENRSLEDDGGERNANVPPARIFQHCNITMQNIYNISPCVTTPKEISKNFSLNLSFIERLGIGSPECSSSNSLYLDDDLNESNIMEIKSIKTDVRSAVVPEGGRYFKSTNPFVNCSISEEISETTADRPNISAAGDFPFNIPIGDVQIPYIDSSSVSQTTEDSINMNHFSAVPRRLFTSDDNDTTILTIDSSICNDGGDIPSILKPTTSIYNSKEILNKQSKILGCDVSMFKESDILNIENGNDTKISQETSVTTENNFSLLSRGNSLRSSKRSKALLKPALKASNTLSRKVLKKLKHAFKHDKHDAPLATPSGNPYEVPRKMPKVTEKQREAGFENPALSLDYSDIDIEEIDEESDNSNSSNRFSKFFHANKLGTPPKEMTFKFKSNQEHCLREIGNLDIHSAEAHPDTSTRKQVRFDATLNQEKIITGNSFDSFDSVSLEESFAMTSCNDSTNLAIGKINSELEDFHDELENCLNEKKFLKQNL